MLRDVNRLHEMEVFVAIVEAGSFSEAARRLDMSPSAVSKLTSRLEARLGTRLVNRSTRSIELTAEGERFHRESRCILEQMTALEDGLLHEMPRPTGDVRVNMNLPFGLQCVLDLLPGFLACYPGIRLSVDLTDQVVDLVEHHADVAIRIGPMRDSGLLQRKIMETYFVTVAAPSYLESHGTPETVNELEEHNCLTFAFRRQTPEWKFRDETGQPRTFAPKGNILLGDGESMRRLTLAGTGIAQLSLFQVQEDLAAGKLVPVLKRFAAREPQTVHAVFMGPNRYMPQRVRVFVDYLAANLRDDRHATKK
ncbi:LysR family transcriptional regulator [Kozakia baliensis]|uniref:LysR family transcriptional regulator n=1 Tax=Kozakia baliensis TaxID=153496 RepID=A0A1D8UYE6_9PROT|nr:LysR family transcriptional regulator [Kozakia baliensis]AOX18675.1 LysR family transcriptional regulator [Kozakia baliensis]GEL65267.1 LysR family transcriptional regulator [Kozakia baliensis]